MYIILLTIHQNLEEINGVHNETLGTTQKKRRQIEDIAKYF